MRPAVRAPLPSPEQSLEAEHFADNRMHAGEIMNAPPMLSTAPLERARHLRVLADRERIAHELNDHVIQRIFAAGLDLQGTIARSRSSEITARLNRSVTDLQTVIEDIITTVFELHVTGTQQIGSQHHLDLPS